MEISVRVMDTLVLGTVLKVFSSNLLRGWQTVALSPPSTLLNLSITHMARLILKYTYNYSYNYVYLHTDICP